MTCEVLVIGAGPAGSSTAAHLSSLGHDVLLVDAAEFPRDKPCGDGLTPRAIAELTDLGLGEWLSGRARNKGLRAAGFGQTLLLPWPGGSLPDFGSAVPRLELDAKIREVAVDRGARTYDGARAVAATHDPVSGRVTSVTFRLADKSTVEISCHWLVVADGVRSQTGRLLGREWDRTTAYGVAARGYITSERSADPWISSHLELRGTQGELLSGYGWIFPLADGSVNIGVGTLATAKRPADLNLRDLISHYADQRRDDWMLSGEVRDVWSAMLPMGGAVRGVAGPNWVLVGDAAGCVNPLNGEGIDYGLETGHLAANLIHESSTHRELTEVWPEILRNRYGLAFSIARRLAGYLTVPWVLRRLGPIGMRSDALMTVALRVMGNLVTPEDSDLVAKLWRTSGRVSTRFDAAPPWPSR